MSALLLLAAPVVGIAAFRIAASRGLARNAALALAAVVALAATAAPAYLLRTKPSQGSPAATPRPPAYADTQGAVELQVEFGAGWQDATSDVAGRAVRRMSGASDLVVGPLGPGRPPATLEFAAESTVPARLTFRLEDETLARAEIGPTPTAVRVAVPPGDGPATLRVEATAVDSQETPTVTLPLATVRATARVD